MEKQVLKIYFKTPYDENFTLNIIEPKEDLDTMEVESACEQLIDTTVFGEGLLAVKAEIVTTTINELRIQG